MKQEDNLLEEKCNGECNHSIMVCIDEMDDCLDGNDITIKCINCGDVLTNKKRILEKRYNIIYDKSFIDFYLMSKANNKIYVKTIK